MTGGRPGIIRRPRQALLLLSALVLGPTCGEDAPPAAITTTEARLAPSTTVTQRTTAATTTTSSTTASSTTRPSPTTAAPSGVRAATIVVPNMVGEDLQLAQDTMQARGLYALRSHDATGQDRRQVLDRNWTVCTQNPQAGSMVDPLHVIDFGVVRDEERCP